MPLGTRPNFSQVKAFFAGSNNLKDYVRGGAYVPNIAANSAISTTVAGLRLSQFSGADKVTAPPVPTLYNSSANDYLQGAGSVDASITFRSNGQVWIYQQVQGSYVQYTWLPSGRAGSEYQIRIRNANTTGWGAWLSLGTNQHIVGAAATGDGFYDGYDYLAVEIQVGANNSPLTGVFACDATAQVQGRG